MSNLPQAFIDRMAAQLGDELPAFLRTYEEPYQRGVRLNPMKPVAADFLPEGLLEAVPWEPTGHYLSMDSKAGADVLHEAGAWYLQEPSAMIPAAVLNAKPGERILDLCAAPGGKSTQSALRMAGQGTIVCNEPIRDRAKILYPNVERMGIPNAIVVSAWPEDLAKVWPGAFDAIQCDAPCSGEGMFRRHPETRDEWNAESPAGCAKRQGDILDSAAVMLRPGGRLVYSTCTLNQIENEGVVEAFLHRHDDFILEAFQLPGLCASTGMLTIYPHRVKGEGHFVALLRRKGGGTAVWKTEVPKACVPDKPAMKALQDFLPGAQANLLFGGELRYCPDFPDLSKARGVSVLRSGLHLGTVKGREPRGRMVFIPDHAWALCNTSPDVPRVHLTEEDARLYQNGQVIPVDERVKGWVLACFAGIPLGWGKVSDGMMKNHYPKGLRR